MGTNYYWYKDGKTECECCKRPIDGLHIGKSSGGWCFSLHVIPEEDINSLEDWKRVWASGGLIFNENDDPITVEEMLEIILNRSWSEEKRSTLSPEFYWRNHAAPGPNGLLRHTHRAKEPPNNETYDLCEGEFS